MLVTCVLHEQCNGMYEYYHKLYLDSDKSYKYFLVSLILYMKDIVHESFHGEKELILKSLREFSWFKKVSDNIFENQSIVKLVMVISSS